MVLVWSEIVERLVRATMIVVMDIGSDFGSGFVEGSKGVHPSAFLFEGANTA